MKNTQYENDNTEAWENGELGASEKYVRKVSPESEEKVDKRLGLQTISIRLPKKLVDELKALATEDAMGYQPYVRQLLMRHVRRINHDRLEKNQKRGKRRPAVSV